MWQATSRVSPVSGFEKRPRERKMGVMRVTSKGWRVEPRWQWEETGQILVLKTGGVTERIQQDVHHALSELVKDFSLPLRVALGSRDDATALDTLIQELTLQRKLEPQSLLTRINELRRLEARFTPALAVLLAPKKVTLVSSGASRPPIYGVGYDDGLVLLRAHHREAVIHESAHMFGVDGSDPDGNCPDPVCIMNYYCPSGTWFCEQCQDLLQGVWSA